jgi:Tfp pilus assembly protein PilF
VPRFLFMGVMEAWGFASSARTKQEAGDLDGAMKDVEAALAIDRKHAEAIHVRAHVWRDRGRFWRSIRDFKRAGKLASADYRNFY